MSRTLQYHVPPLGLVRTILYQEARELYEFLDKNGEVARLKRLDHLGVVRRASEGAHHPRWEYIMLIMHLVDLTKGHVPEAHLSSGPHVLGHRLSSGQELLKVWAFLLHLGHVPWTFTAERALLAEVKRSEALRRRVLDALPDDEVRSYGRRVIRREDVYRFYHIISFLRLNHLTQRVSAGRVWIAALKAYCLRTASVARLAEIYHRLRQIAFFVLDSHYTPALAGLDLAEILTDPRRLALVLDPPDSSSAALLNAIATHLYESVYLSADVTRHTASLIPALREEIRKDARRPLPDMVEELASGHMQERADHHRAKDHHIVNVPFRVDEPFTSVILPEAQPLREEADWCADLPLDLRSMVSVCVWPFPDGRQETVDVFADQRSGRVVEAGWVAVLSRLARLYREDRLKHGRLLGPDLLQEVLYGKVAVAFLRSVLHHTFRNVVRWEFRSVEGSPQHTAVLVRTRREARSFLSAEIRTLSRRKTDEAQARSKELQAARAALERERGRCFVLALARLSAFDARGRTIGEIDGFWVALAYRRVRVVVVEAKEAQGAQSEIRRQLKRMTRNLGVWPDCGRTVTYRRRTGAHPHFGQLTLRFVGP